MVISLIKTKQLFTLALPKKVKGQYWVSDLDKNGKPRALISVEAVDGEWVLKSNKMVSVLDTNREPVKNTVLKPLSFFNLAIRDSNERILLFCESMDPTRLNYRKLIARAPFELSIGRTKDNQLCYANKFVSSTHAKLGYDGEKWTLTDNGSTNGTYVNGYRVQQKVLEPGDSIYVMGLRILVGGRFLAINNPDGMVSINSANLLQYQPQQVDPDVEDVELPERDYFYRPPRFHREIEPFELTIDPPPGLQKQDSVPMALMLGPSLTMGMTSMSTGLLSASNMISRGGDITDALPTLLMSGGMLMGTVLWPILTKKYEKKNKLITERKRQDKYLAYLDHLRDEIKRRAREQSDIMAENMVSPAECANRILSQSTKLWERVIGQPDFLKLRLGTGSQPLEVEVKYSEKKFSLEDDNLQDAMLSLAMEPKVLRNVPISVSLTENWTAGLIGSLENRRAILRSLLLQMIALHSYDELKIILIADEEEMHQWDFVRFIPHFWSDDKTVRFLATNQDEVKELSAYIEKHIAARRGDESDTSSGQPHYVIISLDKHLGGDCDALRQLLGQRKNKGFSVLHVVPELKDLPKETKLVVHAQDCGSTMFDRDDTTGKKTGFDADTVDISVLRDAGRRIANIELDLANERYSLPTMLTFLEMFQVGKIEHLNSLTRWKENNPTLTLQTPIGVDSYGNPFYLDLHEKYHGPHGLVAGMTGSGKSEFIITYILSLAVNYHPDEVAFILIDYKGGGLAGAFKNEDTGVALPHLAGTITNLDGAAVKRSLISIQSELRRRQEIFVEARKITNEGTMDIYKYQQLYRDKVVTKPLPHLFIISDEFAELKTQQPEFMEQLISAARIGRSLGVHLILATQKPNGVVNEQIWSNSKFRICLKVQETADSQDMIKCPDAAELSQTGRFYLQVGFNELFALGQSAWCGAEYIPSDTVEKNIDSSIQLIDNQGRVVMGVKPRKKRMGDGQQTKQIVSVVKYLSDLAAEEDIHVRPLWKEPIPERIFVADLECEYNVSPSGFVLNPVVGEYDDPFNQSKGILTVPFSTDGNCLIYGATGNGKTMFLTTLCYSLLKNHTANELNLYIMDFGSETLRVFEGAPQVGGVVTGAEEEQTVNLFKMLLNEMDRRKNLFSEFGGDHASYCRNSGQTIPNIVVALNNFSGFSETYEELIEPFNILTRDCVKYGIYFVVSAGSTNAVRYRTQQNFKTMYTMQLNDASDYTLIVGKTEGLIPSKFKGRGLAALDRVYEFQTAACADVDDQQAFLRSFCAEQRGRAVAYAPRIPVLPNVVDLDFVRGSLGTLEAVPVGVAKKQLDICTANLENKVVYPVLAQDISDAVPFAEELCRVLDSIGRTVAVDAGQRLDASCQHITSQFEDWVVTTYWEMVTRNNDYKDAGMDVSVLDSRESCVYVIFGLKQLEEQLTEDGRDKLFTMIEKAQSLYKLHFVIIEDDYRMKAHQYDKWYAQHISGSEGIWIGDGVQEQRLLTPNGYSSELSESIGSEFGYILRKKQYVQAKLLSSARRREYH